MKQYILSWALLASFSLYTISDFTNLTEESHAFFTQMESRVAAARDPYFVILIPTYKNESLAQKNLLSALDQTYDPDHFSILVVNDCSPDNTGAVVKETLEHHVRNHHALLIDKTVRHGAMYNQYHAAHASPDNAIIIILDGDDWFAHDDVLERIAQEYRKGAWLTYGQFLWLSHSLRGICKPIPDYVIQQNAYRQYNWVTSHVRTFYAGLFKKIKQEDLMLNGEFVPMAPDVAEMMPMLEMAGPRAHFIEDVLYIYNDINPINEHHVNLNLQRGVDLYIRRKPPYQRLQSLE